MAESPPCTLFELHAFFFFFQLSFFLLSLHRTPKNPFTELWGKILLLYVTHQLEQIEKRKRQRN